MSLIEQMIHAMTFALGKRYPKRLVTTNLVDFADRKSTELEQGIYSLVFVRQSDFSAYSEKVDLMLVGQVALRDSATGAEVQATELQMLEEIKSFIQSAPFDLFRMVATKSASSAQLEAPYGWVSVDITIGPFDSSDLILPLHELDGLANVVVNFDIQPFASKTEHQQLLNDESVPNLPDAMDLIQVDNQ
jgi:hypothetical protein